MLNMFEVHRHVDHTGLSGTGVVAEGIVFSDGTVAMRWLDIDHESENYKRGVRPTTVMHESIDSVTALHGHNGATEVVFLGNPQRLEAELREQENYMQKKGLCPHSGLTVSKCQSSDICDCFFTPTGGGQE